MDKVFDVDLSRSGHPDDTHTTLTLPAYPYALRDALEKVRPWEGTEPYIQIKSFHRCEFLAEHKMEIPSLQALNAFAIKLAELDERQLGQFQELVEPRHSDGRLPIHLKELYNLAASTGVSMPQTGEIRDAYSSLRLDQELPSYAVLLDVRLYGEEEPMRLWLPEDDMMLSIQDVTSWQCLDCRAPVLTDAITNTDSLALVRYAAQVIGQIPGEDLTKYNALLQCLRFSGLSEAVALATSIDQFLLTPKYTSPAELAEDDLRFSLNERQANTLLSCVDLSKYGKELLKQYGMALSEYGLFERKNGHNFGNRQEEPAPSQGGMEMEGF